MNDVTRILNAMERGDTQAADELLPVVYEELRILAAQKLSHEPPGQTLQATALVHEAYLRLVGCRDAKSCVSTWENRGHFFAAAAEAMRRILVENARRKKSLRHGGGDPGKPVANRPGLEGDRHCDDSHWAAQAAWETSPDDLLALDEALAKLAQSEPQVADFVKLRYFAGLTIEQIARMRGVTDRTVFNYLAYARAWLRRAIL